MNRKKKAAALGTGGQNHTVLENLQSKSNSELMAEIDAYMKKAEEQGFDFDPGYIEDRLSILQERDPMEIAFDPAVEIHKLPLNLEAAQCTQTHKHRVKIWRIVEIAAALVILLTIAVGAGKFDIFDWLRKENAEMVSFGVENSGEMNLQIESVSGEEAYHSLQDALDAYGITTAICPTWIPEDYHIESIDVIVDDKMSLFDAAYESDERGRFNVHFTRFQGDAKITSEVEPDGEIYEKNGITYYLFPNLERNKCHWVQDGFLCEINGNLTFDEIKQMIDSIK